MTTINGVGAAETRYSAAAATTNTTGSTEAARSSSETSGTSSVQDRATADKDMFLKLLVAQMKYQDPNEPVDTAQFLSQNAQFTMVERLNNLMELDEDILQASRVQTAGGLLGQEVTWAATDGSDLTGVVTSVSWESSPPTLSVGDLTLTLDDVKSVGQASPGRTSLT
ncbi:MAG: flagellar basal-body rod modification protein FlgD [Actinomycetota bacterium]|nr:flagellar basal-body rod modification protein FlgD [Actinomycetota bacterium]